jgi:hypothetical protein
MESGAGIGLPIFKEVSMVDRSTRILRISCTRKMRWLNLIQLAANTNNVALLYGLFRTSDFTRIVSSPKARFSTNMSSDWWFSFVAVVEVFGSPKVYPKATYLKNRKGISFNSEHYTAKSNDETNKTKTKIGFAVWKTFTEPTIHFFSESGRFSVDEFPKIFFLWQVMIVSRISDIFNRKIRIISNKHH